MEATQGILASQTSDGWAVEIDHAVIRVESFTMQTANGDDANLAFDPAIVELVPDTVLIDEIRDTGAYADVDPEGESFSPNNALDASPVNQQFFRRNGIFGFEVVAEPICNRFEYRE